ncbi:MAG TPA: class I SAM-dependent methyltransferase, partial [Verrucomicrobiae bacterium]|nr:class I SAM-dependent methyltransferase [Verrucomicrobiae bacterium]
PDEILEMTPLEQHQSEIQKNLRAWKSKPLLQKIYAGFYQRIIAQIDTQIPGRIVEIGSGIGNLKSHLPQAITTDLFPNPWLDVVCDGYDLPFADATLSHLVLFDVFHHLRAPNAFLREARRVLTQHGRIILFEPYISWASLPVYGLLHHEPIGSNKPINLADTLPRPRDYYAAQGNATRLFFRREIPNWPESQGWTVAHREAFSSFSYLLSGGYSKPAFYPGFALRPMQWADNFLSLFPRVFSARCLIVLQKHV